MSSIEVLENEYEDLLKQYETAQNVHLSSLDNTAQKFIAIIGKTFWGTAGLSEGAVKTQEECENMCANNANCTGATYNPTKKYCWARSGDGDGAVDGLADDVAIMREKPKTRFISLAGRTFWGTTGLSEGAVATTTECEDMCAIDEKCSGATFNSDKRYCWTRSGDGHGITAGTEMDTALMPAHLQSARVVQKLNDKLTALNIQIATKISQTPDLTPEKQKLSDELAKANGDLSAARAELTSASASDDVIMSDTSDKLLYTDQQVWRFWIMVGLGVCIGVIALKFIVGRNPPNIYVAIIFVAFVYWLWTKYATFS